MRVERIEYEKTKDFILNKHYAGRMPSVTYAFGLFVEDELQGVCTIGKPASHSLCKGLLGEEYAKNVFELNRLVVNDNLPKNTLSKFLSSVLKLLKDEDIALVSYADEGMGHHGYIYQATNWIYTGKTAERTDKYVPSGRHSRHYTNENPHLRKFRSSKFRYVYFPNRKTKNKYLEIMKYEVQEYPKGENERYLLGEKKKEKIINTIDNSIFYE